MNTTVNKLAISIDLDEWYHARWCTGSDFSMWRSTEDFFHDYYQQDQPIGELVEPTEYILGLLKEHGIQSTFFVLGEVARFYPELLRRICANGHEIACHGLRHIDMDGLPEPQFIKEISEAKEILEEVTGKQVNGFRIPNTLIPPYLIRALERIGFQYDSSLFPSRRFLGKYGYARSPLHPYRASRDAVEEPGDSTIIELPVAVFPGLRLVAGSGIFTRVFGYWWTRAALKQLLRHGDTVYYFHPYELMPPPRIGGMKQRLFLANCGKPMRRSLNRLLKDFEGKFATAGELCDKFRMNGND